MASIQFDVDDDYDKKCGEMFLTLKGNIVFHCTLCDNKYEVFEQYADHVLLHYIRNSDIKQEIADEVQPAQLNDDNRVLVPKWKKNKPPPISELMTKLFDLDDSTPQEVTTIKEETIDEEITGSMLLESQPNDSSAYSETLSIKLEFSDTQPYDSSTNSETLDIKVEFSETEFSDELAVEDSMVNQPVLDNINYLYECSQCNEVFATPNSLQDHKQQQHLSPSAEPKSTHLATKKNTTKSLSSAAQEIFVCECCGKGYPSSLELKEHIEYYTNENHTKCTFCELIFESCVSLHRHMGVHYHERHYECDICKARFKKQRGLNEHRNVHENQERKFACKMCDKKFQLKAGLKWHMRKKHLKTMDNTHGCTDYMEVNLGSHVDAMTSAGLL